MNPTSELIAPEVQELIEGRQYAQFRESIEGMEPADIADVFRLIPADLAAIGFRLLPHDEAADVLSYFDAEFMETLVAALGTQQACRILDEMSTDDLAGFLEEVPAPVAQGIVASLKPENRQAIQAILGYPEESVGRIMTSDYVRVRAHWSVAQALEHIRRYGRDAETVNVVYVVDDKGKLVADIRLRAILLADPESVIQDIIEPITTALRATDDQESAVRMMARYDRIALPVVDSHGVLVGIVTADDVADIAEEEVTEDIQQLAGVEALDEPYMATGFVEMLRKRAGVLAILLVAQSVTIGVLGFFEGRLSAAKILILFIPLIIASGGNTGTQTASLLIRAIALNELGPDAWKKVLLKELATGAALGVFLGLLSWLAVLLWNLTPLAQTSNPLLAGATVGLSVLGIVLWAVSLGSMLPLILQRLKLDPTTISSPLVATLMDVSGLTIYLTVAIIMLTAFGEF